MSISRRQLLAGAATAAVVAINPLALAATPLTPTGAPEDYWEPMVIRHKGEVVGLFETMTETDDGFEIDHLLLNSRPLPLGGRHDHLDLTFGGVAMRVVGWKRSLLKDGVFIIDGVSLIKTPEQP